MGAAVHVPDDECDGRGWPGSSMRCSPTPTACAPCASAARAHGHPDAAAHVAELVDAHAR